ncbi:hypothetical protein A2U01_0094135, partial [Trifolium medium]|nr:hypothetical protein [Trifolium medium]
LEPDDDEHMQEAQPEPQAEQVAEVDDLSDFHNPFEG